MTLQAYSPTGKRITHEFWGNPRTAPVTFERGRPFHADTIEVQRGILARVDYAADGAQDGVMHHRNPRNQPLRWMCESGQLWADEDLTFKEEDE